MHVICYTGYRAILLNGREMLETIRPMSTSWSEVPAEQVAVLELWWKGVKKVSIDFMRARERCAPFYSITASVGTAGHDSWRMISRNIGKTFPDGSRIVTCVNELTGEIRGG